ncbi:hypothetical protein WA158_008219 [Blastocystis sp. Blastoise]
MKAMKFIILWLYFIVIVVSECSNDEIEINMERQIGIYGTNETWIIHDTTEDGTIIYSHESIESETPGGWYSIYDNAYLIFRYNEIELFRTTFDYNLEKALTRKVDSFYLSLSILLMDSSSLIQYTNISQYDSNWRINSLISNSEWLETTINHFPKQSTTRYYRYKIQLNNPIQGIIIHLFTSLGTILYFNNIEIYRIYLPNTPILPSTLATTYIQRPQWIKISIPFSLFSIHSSVSYILGIETHINSLSNPIDDKLNIIIEKHDFNNLLPLYMPSSITCTPGSKLPIDFYGQCSDLFDNSYNSMFYGKSANTKITIRFNGPSVKKYSPTSWNLFGSIKSSSDNENEWILIDIQRNINWTKNVQSQSFYLLSNHVYWNSIQLVILNTINNDYLQITSLFFSYDIQYTSDNFLNYDKREYLYNENDSIQISPSSSSSSSLFSSFSIFPSPLSPYQFDTNTGIFSCSTSSFSSTSYIICGILKTTFIYSCTEFTIKVHSYCHQTMNYNNDNTITIWPDLLSNHRFTSICPLDTHGELYRECTNTYEWSTIINTCIDNLCESDGIWNQTKVNTLITLPCPSHYQGIQTRYCNSSMKWETIHKECIRYMCEEEEIDTILWESTSSNTYRYHSCPDTIHFNGYMYRYCNSIAEWEPIINNCTRTYCEKDTIWNESPVNSINVLPCDDSIHYYGNKTRQCTVLHGWEEPQINCELIPLSLSYPLYSIQAWIYHKIPIVIPTYSGGFITGFSIKGKLPKGISFDLLTGILSGTPLEVYTSIIEISLHNKFNTFISINITIDISNIYCQQEYEWNKTSIDTTIIQWCPSGYIGIQSRYCSFLRNSMNGLWLPADTTRCLNSSITQIPMKYSIYLTFSIYYKGLPMDSLSDPQTYEDLRFLISQHLSTFYLPSLNRLYIIDSEYKTDGYLVLYRILCQEDLLNTITHSIDILVNDNPEFYKEIKNHQNQNIQKIFYVNYDKNNISYGQFPDYLPLFIIIGIISIFMIVSLVFCIYQLFF